MTTRKTFVVDTSVLLYDKCSVHSFPGNDVIIPLPVLDEIDRFKDAQGILGDSARYVNRFLDSLRGKGNLYEGVTLENDQVIRVIVESSTHIPSGLNTDYGDNKILGAALLLKEQCACTPILITKDINLRVKCDALGITAEDYYKDRVIDDKKDIYAGVRNMEIEDYTLIDQFHVDQWVPAEGPFADLNPNEFVIAKCGQQSMMGVREGNRICPIKNATLQTINQVNPRNKEQKFAIHLLQDTTLPLVTINGIAGSGKTYLTLMVALSGLFSKQYERIVFTRSIQPVGKDIGFLPGDLKEKMSPWMSPIMDNFRQAFKDNSMFDMMWEKGQIEVAPLTYIRGRTFDKSFIIVDEAQNATIHELKTVITRVGKDSKIVLLGDTDQVDTPYVDSLSNGLTIICEKFKTQELAGHVTLMKGERSEIATLASKII